MSDSLTYLNTVPQGLTRRRWLTWTSSASLLPLIPACGGSNSENELWATKAWARQAIEEAMQQSGTRAVSVALLVGEDTVWQEAFGVVDEASGRPATVDTRFNIGSVSKVLAALAISILVDRRQVELDAPVVTYLPAFTMLSPAYRRITVRHLLSHASGLPGTHMHNMFATAHLPGYGEEMLAWLSDAHLKHDPGAMATYCNDGFTLCEAVVQAVTGQTYPHFVKQAVLEPLGMHQSDYTLTALPEGSFAHAYLDGVRQAQEYVMGYATGGLCTTPGDMMKLAAMLLNGGRYRGQRLLSEARVAEMARDQTQGLRLQPTPGLFWGLGWDSVRQGGMAAVGVQSWQKNGGTLMYSSDFFVLPQERMALLITGSGPSYGAGRLAEGILLHALHERGRIPALPNPVSLAAPPMQPALGVSLSAVLGIYGRSSNPLKVSSPDGQRLDLSEWSGEGWATLQQGLRLRTDGWWWADGGDGKSYRFAEVEGHTYLIERLVAGAGHYRLEWPLGERMPAAEKPLPALWRARLGTWQVTNEAPESLVSQLGGDTITLGELPELPGYLLWDNGQFLRPLSDSRAGMCVQVPVNHGRDLVEVVAEPLGGEEQLRTSGWYLRRVR